MGLATIFILICHAPINGVQMPKLLEYTIVQGQIGVDIFLFLSGMGLWYSLNKEDLSGGGKKWYLKRYIRILVPYLLIQSIIAAILCLLDNESICFFVSYVSTIEFWLSHRGAWFIALLLPLYLITPLLFLFLRDNGLFKFVVITIICYLIALYPNDTAEWTLFKNIQYAIIRVPVFVMGMYMGPKIRTGEYISNKTLLVLFTMAIVVLLLTKKPVNSYLFLVLPLILLLSKSFSFFESGAYNSLCRFYGKISLESYLWNAIGRFVLIIMTLFNIPDYDNILMYSIVILLGTVLSTITHGFTKPIITMMNNNLFK